MKFISKYWLWIVIALIVAYKMGWFDTFTKSEDESQVEESVTTTVDENGEPVIVTNDQGNPVSVKPGYAESQNSGSSQMKSSGMSTTFKS